MNFAVRRESFLLQFPRVAVTLVSVTTEMFKKEIAAAVKSPDIRARLLELGIVPEGDSPASFAAYVKADIAKWKRVIEQANVPKI